MVQSCSCCLLGGFLGADSPQGHIWVMFWKELVPSREEHRAGVTATQGGQSRLKPGMNWGAGLFDVNIV